MSSAWSSYPLIHLTHDVFDSPRFFVGPFPHRCLLFGDPETRLTLLPFQHVFLVLPRFLAAEGFSSHSYEYVCASRSPSLRQSCDDATDLERRVAPTQATPTSFPRPPLPFDSCDFSYDLSSHSLFQILISALTASNHFVVPPALPSSPSNHDTPCSPSPRSYLRLSPLIPGRSSTSGLLFKPACFLCLSSPNETVGPSAGRNACWEGSC